MIWKREEFLIVPPFGALYDDPATGQAIADHLQQRCPKFRYRVTTDSPDRQEEFYCVAPMKAHDDRVMEVVRSLVEFVAVLTKRKTGHYTTVIVNRAEPPTLH